MELAARAAEFYSNIVILKEQIRNYDPEDHKPSFGAKMAMEELEDLCEDDKEDLDGLVLPDDDIPNEFRINKVQGKT